MRLEKFRVTHFRNINDSGWIQLAENTALVGRNESGKTNLLHALASLNGAATTHPPCVARDFPADRLRSEHSDELDVVVSSWQLTEQESAELAEIMPRAEGVKTLEIGRGYPAERWVRFPGLPESMTPVEKAKELVAALLASASSDDDAPDPIWNQALDALQTAVSRRAEDHRAWASDVTQALTLLQEPVQLGGVELGSEARGALEQIAELATQMANDSERENAARQWVFRKLPRFLYLAQYPEIDGQMNLAEFVMRRRQGQPEPGDACFEMLLRVSGIDPEELDSLLSEDHELRRQLVSRAGAVLTRTLRELWSDRALKVRFNLDGDHFNTLVCDPTALCDIEVNLNQRSSGFRWFFSFFVMLAAGGEDGSSSSAILLLDEPGLHLHAVGQKDLVRYLTEGIRNQTILATQSPFMLPSGASSAVRTVTFDEEAGATVDEEGAFDAGELAPRLHNAVSGVAQGLFGDAPRLVVEDLTDLWYLHAVSEFLADQGKPALPKELSVTPAGGASMVPTLLELLGQRNGHVVLSSRPVSESAEQDSNASPGPENTIFIGEGLENPPPDEVMLEDLVEPAAYERFVRFAYREKLKDKKLEPDPSIGGIVKRYQDAFARLGLEFSRVQPARLVVGGSQRNMLAFLSGRGLERLERLVARIRERHEAPSGAAESPKS
jgi:energy-coupling factor transporter ATP-binding protein EcfA2